MSRFSRLKMLGDMSDPNRKLVVSLYGGAAAIFGLFAFALSMPLISNPTFCAKTCHSQAPQWEAWRRSAHAQVTCYACHVDKASLSHLIEEKFIAGPLGIMAELRGSYERPINKESHYSQEMLPRERCERCHTNENRKFTFSRGIYMNHEAHKAAGINCTVCHNRIAHKGAEKFEPLKTWASKTHSEESEEAAWRYKDFTTMSEGCMRCHSTNRESKNPETLELIKNGKEPPTACATCHTTDMALPEGHGTGRWRTDHGEVAKRDFSYCFKCHDADAKFSYAGKPWCLLCHDQAKVDSFKQAQVSLK